MPRRYAVSRSKTSFARRPRSCSSLATSRSSGSFCSSATICGAKLSNSSVLGSSSVYWNWVRLTRSSTVKSCTGCMNRVMPETLANAGCRRRITSLALIFRSSSGLRLMRMRPLFIVVFVPSMPMNEERLSMAGSFRMILASSCCSLDISSKDTV